MCVLCDLAHTGLKIQEDLKFKRRNASFSFLYYRLEPSKMTLQSKINVDDINNYVISHQSSESQFRKLVLLLKTR